MPSVPMKHSLGLTTLKEQSVLFKAGGQTRTITIPSGKVISQQLIDIVLKVAPADYEIAVVPLLGIQEIIQNNRLRVETSGNQGAGAGSTIAVEYDEGTTIFEQGDKSNEMYVLESGSVSVWVSGTQVATIDKKGTYFGELSILTNLPRSATIVTLEKSRFHVVPGAHLESAVQQNPTMGYKLAMILVDRLIKTNKKVAAESNKAKTMAALAHQLADDLDVFLSKAQNPLIQDLKRQLNHPDLLGDDGLVDRRGF